MKTTLFKLIKKNIRHILFILFALLVSSFKVNADSITIVKNHKANAIIVLRDSVSQQIHNAANILQNYVMKSTGALLPISNHSEVNTISIHIGLTDFVKAQNINIKKMDEDGFILQGINAKNFVILGGSDWGTEFGVYSFLERFLNVHWLMPTDLGTDIPNFATVKISMGRITESPIFLSRQISPINIYATDLLGNWGRFNRLKGRIDFHSNLFRLFDPKEYYKTNPQFYGQSDGSNVMPSGIKWQPNFSAPGIVDAAVSKIDLYFKQNPKAESFSLGINDGTHFDESHTSLARRKGTKNYLGLEDVSDDYFEWVNEVVQKVTATYPDKIFGLLAYNNVAEPPSAKIGVNPHVVPYLTYERLKWADPVVKEAGHKLTLEWLNACHAIGWYDYAYGVNYLLPRVWFHEMQDYLTWGAQHSVKFYYAELYPNWGEGPKPWIQAKLLWNPYQNVDSLLNIWYVSYAGPKAGNKLKQFYEVWEKFWTHDILSTNYFTQQGQFLYFYNVGYMNAVPKEIISKCDVLINEAYSLAESDLQKQRVAELKEMWTVYRSAWAIYTGGGSNPQVELKTLQQSSDFNNLLNNLASDSIHSPAIKNIKVLLKIK